MEAILKFNLPEDHIEFEMAVNGSKMHSVLWEMDQYLRKHIKYDESLSEEQLRVYEGVREELHGFMVENKVDLYEVE